jgi:hypothetical protein
MEECMRQALRVSILILVGVIGARAEDLWQPRSSSVSDLEIPLALPSLIIPIPPDVSPSIPDDSTPQVHPRLMPQNVSWMENALWGESGLVRKIGIAGDLTPKVRKHELSVRRTMLTMHQIGGFVTWGMMIASCYTGQRVLNGDRQISSTHETLVKTTIGLYAFTALLAVLSPPPLIRRDETSTTTIHKTLAWVHFIGMVVTPIIGSMIWHYTGNRQTGRTLVQNDSEARFHQISAYTTTAVFTASMVIMTF